MHAAGRRFFGPVILSIVAAATLVVAETVLSADVAVAQSPEPPRVITRAAELSIGGRVQTQWSTSSADGAIPQLWEIRRARIELGVRLNTVISARLNPELSGSDVALRDAFVQFDLGDDMQLIAGQAFRPFSLLTQTSSTRILPIERGARIRGTTAPLLEHHNLLAGLGYADRDVGVQLRGTPRTAPLGLAYGIGVFNGPAVGTAGSTLTYQLAARASAAPLRDVRIGGGWSRRHFANPADPASTEVRSGIAWQVDATLGSFAGGPHLLAEAAWGTRDPWDPERSRFRSLQGWAAYRTGPITAPDVRLEPLIRLSHGDPDLSAAERGARTAGGTLVTPGINLYIGPLNRVMVNYDLWSPDGDAPALRSFRVMFQAAF
jgi:hypothetical protein